MLAHSGPYGAWLIGRVLKVTHQGAEPGAKCEVWCLRLPFYGFVLVFDCIVSAVIYFPLVRQEVQLSQRDCATCYVSWNVVICCATVRKKLHLKKRATGEWPWRSLKVTENRAIRWAIYHFLLVVCINSVSYLAPSLIYYNFWV